MVQKKLAAAIAALGALQADVVSALGMGDFTLNSALNQPLDAEIRLLNIADLDESQVLVKMATADDFSRAGVSRDFFLTNIKFNVEVDGKGGGIIRVTTREPVIEPYLNFLVEAHWPSGRMLREFTVLLDLPVFSDSSAQEVASAVSAPEPRVAATTTQSRPAAASRSSSQTSYSPSPKAADAPSAGEEYRVKNDDTLWEIASNSRPNNSISVQQTMVGIQRLNPDAFLNGNINRLRAGSVLRLPTGDQISISERQAIGEVANQNRAWKTGEDVATPTSGAQLDATSGDIAGEGNYGEGSRLSIASGGGDGTSMGDGEGASNSESTALEGALVGAEEDLDKAKLENEELQSRLGDMEAKLATLQRLIELKDDQLAAMQAEGADTNESDVNTTELAADIGADLGSDQSGLVDEEATLDEASNEVASEDTGEAQEDSSAAQEVSNAEEVQEAESPVAAEETLLDKLKSNPLYAGGAGLLILAIAAIVLMRRRKSADEQDDELDFEYEEQAPEAFVEPEIEEVAEEVAEEVEELDAADQLAAELEDEIAAANAEEELLAVDADEVSGVPVESETGDAIAEADIYVAYGRYQQAIDLLRSAADKEPERADIQLKLLEVYVETRDKPAFQQQYAALQTLGDEAAIEQVKEMLSTVDGVSDWLEGMPAAAQTFTDEDMDADLLDDDLVEAGSGIDLDDDADLELDDIELDLDDDLSDDLDLDLELGDLEGASDGLELDDIDLDDDLDLSADISDSDNDIAADKTVQFDVADLQEQLDEVSAEQESTQEDSSNDNDSQEFDLDLDDELDLDSIDESDLGDLEAEFGDTDSAVAVDTSIDEASTTDLDDAVNLDDDLNLDDLAAAIDSDDETLQRESPAVDADSQETVQYSVDDVSAELAAADASSDQSFEEIDAEEPAGDDDFDFLADTDEVATKLDLARAYIDMGDADGAKDILDEVVGEGSDEQIQEAKALMEKMD